MERKLEHLEAEIKQLFGEDDGSIRSIVGYGSVFGNIDSHGDIIAPGAFTKTIHDYRNRKINLYSSHSMNARDLLGTVTDLRQDEFGLRFEAEISQAPSAQDLAIKAKEGHLNEVSIGFFVRDQEFIKNENGERTRVIKEIDLIEISLVSRASNSQAKLLLVKQEDIMSEEKKDFEQEIDLTETAELSVEEIKEELSPVEEIKEEITEVKETSLENNELNELKEQLAELKAEISKPIKKTPHIVEVKEETKKEENMEKKDALFGYVKGEVNKKDYHEMAGLEEKALSSNVAANGGVLVPESLEERIIVKGDQINRAQSRVNRVQVSGPINLVDFDFTETFGAFGENDSIAIDDISNAFGKDMLDPQDFGTIVKLSRRLERRSFQALQPFLADRYAVAYSNGLEEHILRGTGNNEPLGVVTLLNDLAINTTTVTAIANIDYVDMVDLVMSLDEQYRSNCIILCHKDAYSRLMKLLDTANMPVWVRPVTAGAPATFLGYPIFESPALESGGSSGDSPIVFGDFSQYMLAEEIGFRLEVLNELYAGTNQIGLKMLAAYDGMPLDKNAFSRMDIA